MTATLLIAAALVVNIIALIAGFRGITPRYKIARCVGAFGVLMVLLLLASFYYVLSHGMWSGPYDMRSIVYSYWILGGSTVGSALALFSILYKRYFGTSN